MSKKKNGLATTASQPPTSDAVVGFEEKLWQIAEKLRWQGPSATWGP
jgi:hypothetical protein